MTEIRNQHPDPVIKMIVSKWMAGRPLSDWEKTIIADLQEQVAAIQLGRLLLPVFT